VVKAIKKPKKAKAKALTPRQKVLAVADSAASRKAEDLIILNVSKLTSFTDYFVIAHGTSSRQVKAIAESIKVDMKKKGCMPLGVEGAREGKWICVDLGEVIAHIFHHETREFYELEKLWADARRIKYPLKKKKAAAKTKKKT
jgi:ribosome-associated protein